VMSINIMERSCCKKPNYDNDVYGVLIVSSTECVDCEQMAENVTYGTQTKKPV
jgi:hypothetical protein